MSAGNRAVSWLEPLLPAFPGLTSQDAAALCHFEEELGRLLNDYPVTPTADPEPAEPEPAGGPVYPGPVQVPGPRRARR